MLYFFFNFLLSLTLILLITIKIIIFRIQIIIFIILIKISTVINFFMIINHETIIIMIIAIVFFPLQGLSIQPCKPLNQRAVRTDIGGRVCTQCAGCKLYLACLQTPGLRGYRPARRGAAANPAPGVCMLGPRPALAPGGSSLGRAQERVANPTPMPVNPSARYS